MPILLQINIVVNYSSTGRIVEDLGQLAMNNGWESYIAYGRHQKKSKSKLIKLGSKFSINYHVLQTRLFDRHGLGSKRATVKLINQIKEINPDIIHLHNIHGYYINIEVLFSYLADSNIPVVWTLHDCWPFTGHCVYFDFNGCEKWKTGCIYCPQKTTYPASYFLDRSAKNFILKKKLFTSLKNLTIVPASNWLSDLVKQSFLSDYPANVINNGIDLSLFRPCQINIINQKFKIKDKFIILGVSSKWISYKGLQDFIELSKIISDKYQIILIGLNRKQIYNLPDNIIGIERTDDANQLAEFYSAADVYINPTWQDNFPTTNLESLACGTPVITYKTGGSNEAVSSETGFVVEKGNIRELTEKIELVREKGKDYFTQNCLNRAAALYNKDQKFMEYLQLYERLLSQKP